MKTIFYPILASLMSIFIYSNIQSQGLKISLGASNGIVLGDMAGTDLTKNTNAFVDYAFSSNLEIMYTKKNLGFGVRGSFMSYLRNKNEYETAVGQSLNLTEGNYDLRYTNAFIAFSTLVGASYQIKLSEKWALEPYVFIGFKGLTSPYEKSIYNDGSTTFTSEKDPQFYLGLNYIPGLRLQWNFSKFFGVAVFGEFDGASFTDNAEETITYSSTTFNKSTRTMAYNPQSINVGINLNIRFNNCFKCKKKKKE
ncbi:MAG: hypothetical protein ACPGEG_01080 [Salibacteraceae bacterium]